MIFKINDFIFWINKVRTKPYYVCAVKKYYLLSILILFLSCEEDVIKIEKKLDGMWRVDRIESLYGDFRETGWTWENTVVDDGGDSFFNFESDVVNYSLLRNDTLFEGSGEWYIELKKIRSGFFREPEYTLIINDNFSYKITFGHGSDIETLFFEFFPRDNISGPGILINLIR
jgi:hypothetical protein